MTAISPERLPLWLNPAYSRQIVKGNLMTLSAKPKTVDQGEWIAHHVVEHYRNLWNFVRVIHEREETGESICNSSTCPKMSAGPNHSYTWLNRDLQPCELPAYDYMTLMQRWIGGKVNNIKLFPVDPSGVSYASNPAIFSGPQGDPAADYSSLPPPDNQGPDRDWVGRRSGFSEEFAGLCRTIFLQMLRVYAHLYHSHFVEPFYHLNLEKQLNSCFSHFVMTTSELGLLKKEDYEPMQGLIDLWAAMGTFPTDSKAYQVADVNKGNGMLQMAAF